MRAILICLLPLLVAGCIGTTEDRSGSVDPYASLKANFKKPEAATGPRCWWWLNSNVTKDAITRDLEAMHSKGFSGAMIFDAGTEEKWRPDDNPPTGPKFSGPEWTELYLHALREAKRFGLELRKSGLLGPVEILESNH